MPEDGSEYRLVLTREGWLQPWVRLRKTEDEENKRLAGMSTVPNAQQVGRDQARGRGPFGGSRLDGGQIARLSWRSRSARGTWRRS